MTEYSFTLKFALDNPGEDFDELVERLGEAGCTDALVGIGQPGRIGLEFTREARSASEAVLSAFTDVKRAIPDAELVEAAPDLVGLTDIAELLGFSRQYMRKLAIPTSSAFPPPVHEGTPTIWHLATVLDWLKNRANYEIDDGLWEVAKTNRLLNLARELRDLDAEPAFQRDLMHLMATLDKITPDFMVDRKQPARQKRESAFD